MKKNNLDNLFQDRLKDYEESPPEGMWERISGTLDQQKKKKRLLALWWKLGGVAAVLALFIYLGLRPGSTDPDLILTDTTEQAPGEQKEQKPVQTTPTNAVAGSAQKSTPITNTPARPVDEVRGNQLSGIEGKNSKGKRNATLARTLQDIPQRPGKKNGDEAARKLQSSLASVSENAENRQENNKALATEGEDDNRQGINKYQSEQSSDIAENQNVESIKEPEKERSIFEVVDADKEELAQQEESRKWSVGPRVAPVFFNSFGQGSPIHSSFTANSKSGSVNVSYGIAVSYNLSPKLKIRSGLHKVDYGYDTNDVSFSASPIAGEQTKLDHIVYNRTSRNLVVRSEAVTKEQPSAGLADVSAQSPGKSGRMNQQFGYLEVPLEINYVLSDRKLGVDLIGGVSTLFLTDNSIILEAEGSQTLVGDVNNINKLNFSTNIGLGFYYRLAPSIQLNIDPVFKYQLNTFSDTAGSFNPYSLGVYSGLNIRF
ncbi:outer membrane beta-barrel protein [Zeaxanthinibacter sp. PT1]|uniref:outer membrane beta-barrel protein n=1 Tax=Zeaxanthinibacter TaxID=561554 RepID=UPI00234ABC05|nr:outer membrane beta-barrel protein [Zeaxanthinibacter sp. PT1]MDC6350560.1 outer membrane beta-barrel protein [Zeaxanthinibacter sp. PT1]